MRDGPDERVLARNMIEVHGARAASVARENARGAARTGRPVQARSWIRVLGFIQRQQRNGGSIATSSDGPAVEPMQGRT